MSQSETIENPNEHLVIPQWLNESKFQLVVAKDEPEASRILTFTPVAAVPPGGNFTFVMIRVFLDLEFKGEERHSFSTTNLFIVVNPRWQTKEEILCGQDHSGCGQRWQGGGRIPLLLQGAADVLHLPACFRETL